MKWVLFSLGLCLFACGDDTNSNSSSGANGDAGEATDALSDDSASDDSDDTDSDESTDEPEATDTGSDGSEETELSDGESTDEGETDTAESDDIDLTDDLPDGGVEATDEAVTDPELPPEEPEPVDPISLQEFCDGLRSQWLLECEAAVRQDCDLVDDVPGALACAATPSYVESGALVYDGEAAAICLSDDLLDVFGAWEGAYLTGAPECWEVFLPNAEVGDPCSDDTTFTSFCAEGYCAWSGAFEGQCVMFAQEGESCADVECSWNGPASLYCDAEEVCLVAKAEGEPCAEDFECDSYTCEGGECVVPVSLGEDCSDTVCRSPYICKDDVCVDEVEEGDRCTLPQQCPQGLYCIYPTPGAEEQACTTLPEDGDPCDTRSTCAGDEIYCEETGEPNVGVCDSFYAEEGEPCGNELSNCRPELFCAQNEDSTTEGTCVPDRGLEEPCGDLVWQSIGNNPCIDGLLCMHASTDTCLPPGELGEPCFYNSEATCADAGTYCSYQTRLCELPVAYGERCNLAFPERSCEEGGCLLVPAEDCDNAPLGDCQDSLCLDLLENGAACTNSSACASGYCDTTLDPAACANQ